MQYELLFTRVVLSVGTVFEEQTRPPPPGEVRPFVLVPFESSVGWFVRLHRIDLVLQRCVRWLRCVLAIFFWRGSSVIRKLSGISRGPLLRVTLRHRQGEDEQYSQQSLHGPPGRHAMAHQSVGSEELLDLCRLAAGIQQRQRKQDP